MLDWTAVFANYDGAWPDILAKNVAAPGADDGTEFIASLINDGIWGWQQALMDGAGLSPNGITEAAGGSQILTAFEHKYALGAGIKIMYEKNGTPAANGDRVLLLQGQVIALASYTALVAACYVGDGNNPTAPAYYKTSDAGGTTRDTSGGYFVLPDHRAMSPKGVGTTTLNARTKTGPTFTTREEDNGQSHWTRLKGNVAAGNTNFATPALAFGGNIGGSTYYAHTTQGYDNDTGIGNIPITDGVNGTPRTGANTRDCTIG